MSSSRVMSPIKRLLVSSQTFASDNLAYLAEVILDAFAVIGTLWVCAIFLDQGLTTSYLVLSVILFALTYPGSPRLELALPAACFDIVVHWVVLFAFLIFFGWSTGHLDDYSLASIECWFLAAPLTLVSLHLLLRLSMPVLMAIQGGRKRSLIVGMNEHGVSLARALDARRFRTQDLVGFVDDRDAQRLSNDGECPLLGKMAALPELIRRYRVSTIYLSLPMATQPRILQLLDDLRDTTASVYFVPDIFVTDLIQGHMSSVNGIPVVAVCESPFAGINGPIKRVSDILLSALFILLLSPVLLFVALGVKLSSPGPIVFKQWRYGLDGERILVYKFRSMTVTEDGNAVYTQVTRDDARVTRFGSFIRKTSLDELPQLFNVLLGGMSIVGPRPHAVRVNEHYRRQIPGYMIRHKVRPGITGWAQVNGYRGGDDLDSMRSRVQYDIDYLRNWSLRLDLRIIIRTALVVFKDTTAY